MPFQVDRFDRADPRERVGRAAPHAITQMRIAVDTLAPDEMRGVVVDLARQVSATARQVGLPTVLSPNAWLPGSSAQVVFSHAIVTTTFARACPVPT